MSKIIGVTVGTPMSVNKIKEKINPVTTDELQNAVETALQEAKDSGAFNGPKGDTGATGPKGDTGPAGADGKTPVKGTDYFTPADKAEMVTAVIAALPVYNGEAVVV